LLLRRAVNRSKLVAGSERKLAIGPASGSGLRRVQMLCTTPGPGSPGVDAVTTARRRPSTGYHG
jgi:hypothetical protein